MRRWDRHSAIVVVLIALATIVRVYRLTGQSLWRDEVDALRFAQMPLPEFILQFSGPGQNGPLYFLALRLWITLVGTGEFALRYFSVFGGVLAVAAVYVLGRRLAEPLTGGIAALFLALSPYAVWYSQETKMYSWLVLLAILSVYFLHCGLAARRTRDWLAYVAITSLALYTHILAALLVPLSLALVLVWGIWQPFSPKSGRTWVRPTVALASLTLPYTPLLRWEAPYMLATGNTGYWSYSMPEMLRILWNKLAFGEVDPGLTWAGFGLAAAVAMGILSLVSLWSKQDVDGRHRVNVLALLLWFALPVALIYLISLRHPVFTDRYLIWVGPGLYLLAALGLTLLGRRSKLLALAVIGLVIASDGSSLFRQATTPIKSDFRSAAAYVVSEYRPGDELIFQTPYIRLPFDYYFTPRPYTWAGGLYTNAGESEDQVATDMSRLTRGHKIVWLVLSESDVWDRRELVYHWLQGHARLADWRAYTRVSVYRFVMQRE